MSFALFVALHSQLHQVPRPPTGADQRRGHNRKVPGAAQPSAPQIISGSQFPGLAWFPLALDEKPTEFFGCTNSFGSVHSILGLALFRTNLRK